ncbi:hypothetical protein CAPTEDRAFT_116986 [Capitella teleta]|uniref:BTB domain-containing protein n=1 Tax=Capitella teleta TaxID=283909 RepID=R7UBP9_CAPTE|nr:hypothetical protein CAPTEDRAFT_116986 [Capitella teleta]|eukprot:ELU03516.1 hypothetical protein CAPTEDRAFT_116986 [Capitella teleta]
MREAGELVDVTLVFGERRLACHKLILAGMCEYFHRMFLTDMVESYSKEIFMKDINASTGVLLIDYFYTQQIDIATNNAQDLLKASDMLLIETLKRRVEEFLCEQIEESNCISLLNLARFYGLEMLQEDAQVTLYDMRADDIINMEDIHLLEEKDLIKILTANDALDESLCLVQKWILCTLRSNSFDSLLELLHSTHGLGLNDLLEEPSLVVGNFEGEMWQSFDNQTWQPIWKPPFLNEVYSACAHPDGRIIISGGVFVDVVQSDCRSYDAHTAQWNDLPPMPTVRTQHSSIYHDHHVYVIGGNDGQTMLNSVDALDMRSLEWSKTWHQRSPMPEQCAGGAAVALGDQVYVVGGWKRSCMKFNPQIDSWVSLQRPQFLHWYGPSLVLKGCVLIYGGSFVDFIEKYSPLTDKWTTLTGNTPQKQEMRFALTLRIRHDLITL